MLSHNVAIFSTNSHGL